MKLFPFPYLSLLLSTLEPGKSDWIKYSSNDNPDNIFSFPSDSQVSSSGREGSTVIQNVTGSFPVVFILDILDDEVNTNEISYSITRLDLVEGPVVVALMMGGIYPAADQEEHLTIPEGGLYDFELADKGGDGFLGSYKLYLGTNVVTDDSYLALSGDGKDLGALKRMKFIASNREPSPEPRNTTLQIHFNSYPSELEWFMSMAISDDLYEVVAFGPPELYDEGLANSMIQETVLLPAIPEGKSQPFRLVVSSRSRDWVFQDPDSGFVQLYDGDAQNGRLIVESPATMRSYEILPFTLSSTDDADSSNDQVLISISVQPFRSTNYQAMGWRVVNSHDQVVFQMDPGSFVSPVQMAKNVTITLVPGASRFFLFELYLNDQDETSQVEARYEISESGQVLASGDGSFGIYRYHHFDLGGLSPDTYPITMELLLDDKPNEISWSCHEVHYFEEDVQIIEFSQYRKAHATAGATLMVPRGNLYRFTLSNEDYGRLPDFYNFRAGSTYGDRGGRYISKIEERQGSAMYTILADDIDTRDVFQVPLEEHFLRIQFSFDDFPGEIAWVLYTTRERENSIAETRSSDSKSTGSKIFSYGPILEYRKTLARQNLTEGIPIPFIDDGMSRDVMLIIYDVFGDGFDSRETGYRVLLDDDTVLCHGKVSSGFGESHFLTLEGPLGVPANLEHATSGTVSTLSFQTCIFVFLCSFIYFVHYH